MPAPPPASERVSAHRRESLAEPPSPSLVPCPTDQGNVDETTHETRTRGTEQGTDLRSPPRRFRSDQLRGHHGGRQLLQVPGDPLRHHPPAARRLPSIRLLQHGVLHLLAAHNPWLCPWNDLRDLRPCCSRL